MSSLYPSSLLNITGVGVSFKCEHWQHPWAKCWLLAKCNGRARFMLTFSGWRLGASGRRCFFKWFLSDISQILIRHCPKIIWTLLEKLSLPSLSYVISWQRGIQLQSWSSSFVNPCCFKKVFPKNKPVSGSVHITPHQCPIRYWLSYILNILRGNVDIVDTGRCTKYPCRMPKRAELGSAKIRPQPWGMAGGPEDRKKLLHSFLFFLLKCKLRSQSVITAKHTPH